MHPNQEAGSPKDLSAILNMGVEQITNLDPETYDSFIDFLEATPMPVAQELSLALQERKQLLADRTNLGAQLLQARRTRAEQFGPLGITLNEAIYGNGIVEGIKRARDFMVDYIVGRERPTQPPSPTQEMSLAGTPRLTYPNDQSPATTQTQGSLNSENGREPAQVLADAHQSPLVAVNSSTNTQELADDFYLKMPEAPTHTPQHSKQKDAKVLESPGR